MIEKHVDIWAVLLLLFVFALFTRSNEAAIRIARARLAFSDQISSVELRISPWRLNRSQSTPSRQLHPACRLI
ncbi:MAG: hypothetical protein WAM39_02615 [Bryobacteraceae bacterium]